jgi:hypothetical protein
VRTEWEPGLVTVSWAPCDCPPARAAQQCAGDPAGHLAVHCNAAPGGQPVWSRPRHEPGYPAAR